jgi:hypothetical protein
MFGKLALAAHDPHNAVPTQPHKTQTTSFS